MPNPAELDAPIAVRTRALLERIPGGVDGAADVTGIAAATFHALIRGIGEPSVEELMRAREHLRVSSTWWLLGAGEMFEVETAPRPGGQASPPRSTPPDPVLQHRDIETILELFERLLNQDLQAAKRLRNALHERVLEKERNTRPESNLPREGRGVGP